MVHELIHIVTTTKNLTILRYPWINDSYLLKIVRKTAINFLMIIMTTNSRENVNCGAEIYFAIDSFLFGVIARL